MSADLLYTDVEESLRSSTSRLLASRLDARAIADCFDGDDAARDVWGPLAAQIGVAGLLVPEDLGGAGASTREAAVVAEALGRGVAPVPFVTSAVVATSLLVAAGDAARLEELVAGEATAVLAVPLSTTPGVPATTVEVIDAGLAGRVTSVADADRARWLVVPARRADGPLELHVVDAEAVTTEAVVSLDMTRPLSDVVLDGAVSTVLADGGRAEDLVRDALLHGAGVLASEQLGLAQWCLDTTLEYVKGRHQFGRAIGSYQAVKHRLADLWVDVVHATAVARYAADCLARGDDDRDVAVSLAQAVCSDVAVHAAEQAIQLHGGIGMTWEHPAHLYLKRAKADQVALGTSEWHRTRLADLVDVAPGAGQEQSS